MKFSVSIFEIIEGTKWEHLCYCEFTSYLFADQFLTDTIVNLRQRNNCSFEVIFNDFKHHMNEHYLIKKGEVISYD